MSRWIVSDVIEHLTYDALEAAYNAPGMPRTIPGEYISQIAAAAAHAARKKGRELLRHHAEEYAEPDEVRWLMAKKAEGQREREWRPKA